MRALAVLLTAVFVVSCGDDGGKGTAKPTTVAVFHLSDEGMLDWGQVPFPSDLYRDDGERIQIGALPIEQGELPVLSAIRALVQTRTGFCATCNVYFRLDGSIDSSSLPDGSEPPSVDDAIVLADVDPASPERGRLFPLRAEWDESHRLVAARPVRGIALRRNRRYAAALTTRLLAGDGTAIGPSDDFRQARGTHHSADSRIEKARDVLAPSLEELERIGVRRERIAALASFTTEDVTADVLDARSAVQRGAPPEVVIERRRTGAEIDELLGVPSADRPGIDVPPLPGAGGTRSIAHDALDEVITGYFLAPRVLSGAGSDIGTPRRDGQGRIVAGPRQRVPFVLTLPAAPASAGAPVVVAHHGFNASRVTGFATANTLARVGAAVLAIDAFQHGDRAFSTTDDLHNMRGDYPGPDGFAETSTLEVSARVFGLVGAEPGLELFPGYSLGAFLQFLADIASAVRVVREGPLADAIGESDDSPDLDPGDIGFIGNSLGAVVGASVLVAEPDVRFAVQNVPPGSIVETLAESPEFRPLVDAVFLPLLGVQGRFDEIDHHLIFDPIVDLTRWVLEPVDPLALAPYLPLDPTGADDPVLFQVAALDEVASSLATESMLAAAGASRVTRYDPASHGMLEVLNQVSKYEPPAAPPFTLRPAELPVANPIEEIHSEIQSFVREHLEAQ
jgi:hypothetical protein